MSKIDPRMMQRYRDLACSIVIPADLLACARPDVRAQWEEGLISSVEILSHIGDELSAAIPLDEEIAALQAGRC